MPRTIATGNYRLETENALQEVRGRRAALEAERAAINREDDDLAFLEKLLVKDIEVLDEHLNNPAIPLPHIRSGG